MFFSHLNYAALFTSAIIYWILGSVWFSLLLGKIWSAELAKHGIKIKKPTKNEMITKFVATFIFNLIVAFGVSIVVYAMGTSTFMSAIGLGIVLGICFSAATMGMAYLWESRSLKLALIDIGYPFFGIIVCSIIMSLWT